MTALEMVATWLTAKVDASKVDHPNANKGLVQLKSITDYEERMLGLTMSALQIISTKLSNDSNDMPHGLAKFTETGIAIGKHIDLNLGLELRTEKHLHMGACFIGALYAEGYLDLYRDEGYSEYASSAPYVIAPTDTFTDLMDLRAIEDELTLLATSKNKIKDIVTMQQGHGRNVLKNADNEDIIDFFEKAVEEGANWVQAADKLQQQSWAINKAVFEIVDRDLYSILETDRHVLC